MRTASGISVAAILFVLPQSCVNEAYDFSQGIDTTVSFGGKSLVFPLGSTEKIKFSTLMSEEDFSYLTSVDGKYRIEFSNKFNFNDDIPDLSAELNIGDVEIDGLNVQVPIDFADIKGTSVGPESIGEEITFENLELPEINLSSDIPAQTFDTGLADYVPGDEELTLAAGGSRTISFPDIVDPSAISNIISDGDYELDAETINALAGENLGFNGDTDFQIRTTFSGNITDISNVRFDPERTGIMVTLKLINPFFETDGGSGSIEPDIKLDLSDLMILEGGSGTVDLSSMELSAGNRFEDSAVFPIEELVLGSGDCTTDGNTTTLDKNAVVSAVGGITFNGSFHTSKELVSNSGGAFGILLEVSVTDFTISDMTFGIKPVEVNENQDVDLVLDPISLPKDITVREVSEIRMDDGSSIDISISAGSLSGISGLSTELNSLVITFPELVESSAFDRDNRYTVTGIDLSENRKISIPVEKLLPPAVLNNQIIIDETVTVQAVASASGSVTLKELQQAAAGNTGITVDISTDNLKVSDYTLIVDPMEYEVDKSREIQVELPDGVKDIGNFSIVPEGNPELVITAALPSVDAIDIRGENLVMTFPDMLVFGEEAYSQGYDPDTHSITFNGELPSEIRLPIASLYITPEQDGTGKYVAAGEVSFAGNVVAASTENDGSVTSTDIQSIIESRIGINAEIPEITVGNVSLDRFETEFHEETSVSLFDFADIPDELVSVDKVWLNGTTLNLSLNAANIPDMSAPVKLDFYVALPKEIVIDDPNVDENNVLHITGELDDNGRFVPEPVVISGLDLSEVSLEGTGAYMVDITVDGSVSVDNPSIDVDELTGDIDVTVSGNIPVEISKVTGYVDYRLDPTDANQGIDIKSELPDILQDGELSLDLTNPYVVLTVNTNLGIPVEGSLQLIPYYNGEPSSEKRLDISLDIEPAASISEQETTVFYLSGSRDGVPAGSEWIEADIASLLSDLPDKIELKVDAGTVSDKLSTVEIVEGESYVLELAYDVVAPLEFGDDLMIAMNYTYPESGSESDGSDGSSDSDQLPDILGELLNMNSLGLTGTIESTLPLQLKMTVTLLDSEKKEIPSEPITMDIQAGSDAHPSVSDIDFALKLADGADGTDLSYFKLDFEITSGNMSGEPVTTESYIQATLKAKVPGGVTVDLSSLGKSEDEDSNI